MPIFNTNSLHTQNDLLMENLSEFYKNTDNLVKFLSIVHGASTISLRIIDWFVTNYAKKNYTIFEIAKSPTDITRFKVYNDYKLKLKAYSKRRFDPFCRWERIEIPCNTNQTIETTIGQLNFFKWSIENKIVDYIEENYDDIERDMNNRNSASKRKELLNSGENTQQPIANKTRKKREELSISASKSIKKETIEIVLQFN